MLRNKINGILALIFIAVFAWSATVVATAPTSTKTMSQNASLYYSPGCSHCQKVLSYLSSVNKTLTLKNTSDAKYGAEFSKLGQSGVPVLVVGNTVINGDTQIIEYLKNHQEVLN